MLHNLFICIYLQIDNNKNNSALYLICMRAIGVERLKIRSNNRDTFLLQGFTKIGTLK